MNEIVLRIEAFFDILATRSVLTELGLVLLTLIAGGVLGMALRQRAREVTREELATPALQECRLSREFQEWQEWPKWQEWHALRRGVWRNLSQIG